MHAHARRMPMLDNNQAAVVKHLIIVINTLPLTNVLRTAFVWYRGSRSSGRLILLPRALPFEVY